MTARRILVIGSGGREHALAWRLAQDAATEVIVAPGNPGIAQQFECVAIGELDTAALGKTCRERKVSLVVIGPEVPLAHGVADTLAEASVLTFGPSREAARLESSKWFAKKILIDAGVPTARAECIESAGAARSALDRFDPPWVLKADGLAAGKGVTVTGDRVVAERFLAECLVAGRFGESGRRVVIEEFLDGEEASVMAVCDGTDAVVLPAARDYKRAHNGDRGANTGGMGALAPHPALDAARLELIRLSIVRPVLATMVKRGTPYRGTLYCGLMLSGSEAHVIEFNCRFGDPETQVIVPLVDGSFGALLASAARGALDRTATRPSARVAVTVALVDEDYPEHPRGGGVIDGLEDLMSNPELLVFHAGTSFENGAWRVRGGRAAYVTAIADTIDEARRRVYAAIGTLGGDGWRYRFDIADLARPATENSSSGARARTLTA